jgi:hypothetical protein
MVGRDSQPIRATLQFASGDRSLGASEDNGGIHINDDEPAQYKAVSGIEVHDLRSAELTYAENGMSIIKIDTKMSLKDFTKKEAIENVYWAEVESHLMKALGAKSIFIFDWVLRHCDAADASGIDPGQGFTPRTPALFAHIGGCAFQSIKGERGLMEMKIIHPPRLQTGPAPCSARKRLLCWQLDDTRW